MYFNQRKHNFYLQIKRVLRSDRELRLSKKKRLQGPQVGPERIPMIQGNRLQSPTAEHTGSSWMCWRWPANDRTRLQPPGQSLQLVMRCTHISCVTPALECQANQARPKGPLITFSEMGVVPAGHLSTGMEGKTANIGLRLGTKTYLKRNKQQKE